ncbi:chloramphenicol acetyltransferase CAT [Deinococcus aerolatus]|uniref:Chloramphenicol acetyltransferase CAT n=1 Tax=Deinococcus aerolatus TaxID=522487 RepID=A0ABQ2G2J7_9DEIO|nr:chloramphenicol acetyltransferase [Deinococcus aerolatus]GGL71823.1 chloramphenicol acetyltransferase CAT [Deinococcus aerolatus]
MLRPLDLTTWPRRQIYQHFRQNPCTFNVTVSVDVTSFRERLKERGWPFVPALIYSICAVVNRLPALRMGLLDGTQPGIWDSVLPLYTVVHPETETFSALWTELGSSLGEFLEHHHADAQHYGPLPDYLPKPGTPPNALNISVTPWLGFSAFELNIQDAADYLLPVVTVGRYERSAGRLRMPVALRANHAACDGIHIAQFYQELQRELDAFMPQS